MDGLDEDDLMRIVEMEMRYKRPYYPTTDEELVELINSFINQKHNYGTIIYAMSLAATETFYYVAQKLNATYIQRCHADLDILRRTRNLRCGCRLLDYEDLLNPELATEENFPSLETLLSENKEVLRDEAKRRLENKQPDTEPEFIKHWEMLAGATE